MTTGETKAGDRCSLCGEGILAVSPSGRHLMCSQCRRISLTKPSPTSGKLRRRLPRAAQLSNPEQSPAWNGCRLCGSM